MPGVIFVAPFYLETTLRFVQAVADLDGVRLGLVSQEPLERLPDQLGGRLAGYWQVENAFDPRQLAQAVRGLEQRLGEVDRVLGVLEELQVPLAEVREGLGIEGMGEEAARNFRDKARMKTVLAAAGLPCARHLLATSMDEAMAFAREVGFPLVVKPPAGSGARATFRVDGREALSEALAYLSPNSTVPVLLEEFVTGEEHSFESILLEGRPVWHSVTHYLPSPLEVLRNPWIQWCVLAPREVDEPSYGDVMAVAIPALHALGMGTGLSHMEWFRRPDGSVAISEVGARPPGAQITKLHSYAHDFDLYRGWAKVMVSAELDPPSRRFAAGAAYLRGQGRGKVVAVHGLDQAQEELGPIVVEARLPDLGQSPSGSYEGEGYVIVRHPETAVVARALARLVSLIRVELG